MGREVAALAAELPAMFLLARCRSFLFSIPLGVMEATELRADPFASPKHGGMPAPIVREEIVRSPALIGALRLVDAGCSLLAFWIAMPMAGALTVIVAMTLAQTLASHVAAVLGFGCLTMIAFACFIHFRHRWAVWIVLGVLILFATSHVISALLFLSVYPLFGIVLLIPPIWLCMQVLSAASEVVSAGVPLSADVREGRIEV